MASFDFKEQAEKLMQSPSGKKISEKKDDLEKLAASPDGQQVRQIIEASGNMEDALKAGDAERLGAAIRSAMSTEAGQRLARSLSDMFK